MGKWEAQGRTSLVGGAHYTALCGPHAHLLSGPPKRSTQDWRSHLPPHSQMPVAFGGALMTPTPPASQAGRSTSLILDSSLFLSSLLRLIACPAPTGQASIRIPFVYRSCLLPWLLTASGNVSRQVKVLEIHISNILFALLKLLWPISCQI